MRSESAIVKLFLTVLILGLVSWPQYAGSINLSAFFAHELARISHGPVRNAHGVPIRHWRIGASREGFRPGKLLSKQLATGDLLTS